MVYLFNQQQSGRFKQTSSATEWRKFPGASQTLTNPIQIGDLRLVAYPIWMWICCQQNQWQFVTTRNKASLSTRLAFELEQQHVYFTRQKTIHRLKLLWD